MMPSRDDGQPLLTLADLFSAGSHLSDVPGSFRGLALARWRLLDLARQAEEDRARRRLLPPVEAPLSRQRLWNPRDDYGASRYR